MPSSILEKMSAPATVTKEAHLSRPTIDKIHRQSNILKKMDIEISASVSYNDLTTASFVQ